MRLERAGGAVGKRASSNTTAPPRSSAAFVPGRRGWPACMTASRTIAATSWSIWAGSRRDRWTDSLAIDTSLNEVDCEFVDMVGRPDAIAHCRQSRGEGSDRSADRSFVLESCGALGQHAAKFDYLAKKGAVRRRRRWQACPCKGQARSREEATCGESGPLGSVLHEIKVALRT